jgi:S1-C subfamily serine protease
VGVVPGNMFVPIDALKPILADMIAEGRPAKAAQPWLGLAPEDVRGHLFVERVSPGGPAEAAGIKPGDLILGVAGQRPADMAAFYRRIWALGPPGTEVPLDLIQGGVPRRVVVKSADRYAWLKLKRSY